jgi:hypothetical protein
MALLLTGASIAKAAPGKTLVQDTLYRADGSAAQGNLTIRWNAFTTSAGEAVAAGEMTVSTGANGALSIPLIPNAGATPAGGYYKVMVKLSDGMTSEEDWVVPATATTTLAVIRAQVVPQSVAAQFVNRAYVDGQISGLAPVATSGSYSDLKNTPAIPNLGAPGAIGVITPGTINGTGYAVNGMPLASTNLSDGTTLLSTTGSYVNPTWVASLDGGKVTGAVNGVPIGVTAPAAVNATTLTARSVNGVQNAAQFTGSDLAAKVAAAIASLPAQSGTVFVPASLAGGTAAGFTLPSNVDLQFDAGTFSFSGPITFAGVNNHIHGVRGATILQFTGATDGLTVVDGPGIYSRYITISDLRLLTSNAAGGAAIRIDGGMLSNAASTDLEVERVAIDSVGGGVWANGIHMTNLQYSHFYDVRVIGSVTAPLYINGSDENLFTNFFANPNTTSPTRCVDLETSTVYAGNHYPSTARFVGGGCYGGYSQSAVYVSAGSYATMYQFTDDNPYPGSCTDGAYSVANGGVLTLVGSGSESSVLVENGGQLSILGGGAGDVTLASTAFSATLTGVSYRSLTNNMNVGVTLVGNSTGGGAVAPLTIGQFSVTDSSTQGSTLFAKGGVNIFGTEGYNFVLGNVPLAFANSSSMGTMDTFFTRLAAHTLAVGSTNGGTDGTIQAAKVQVGTAAWSFGSGAPTAGNCTSGNIGSLYSNTAGGTSTTLYVCTAAGTWTAK